MKKPNRIRDEMLETHRSMLAKYRSQRPLLRALRRQHPQQAARERAENRAEVLRRVEAIQGMFEAEVIPLLRRAKKHVPDILANDEKVAGYWLLGKIESNWHASFLLAKEGMYYEVVELLRSIKESVALISHFLVQPMDHLERWFAGEIIDPARVRR